MNLSELMGVIQGLGARINILGIPFYVSLWTVALLVVFALDAKKYIARQTQMYSSNNFVVAGITASFAILASVMLHEASHSIVGWFCGLTTTNGGVSWWGAYVEFNKALNSVSPMYEVLVSVAGPIANFALAGIASLAVATLGESTLENTIQYTAHINYRLGVLNLLPVMGLDGSKVLDGVLRPFLGSQAIAVIIFVTTFFSIKWFLNDGFKKKTRFEYFLESA